MQRIVCGTSGPSARSLDCAPLGFSPLGFARDRRGTQHRPFDKHPAGTRDRQDRPFDKLRAGFQGGPFG